MYIDGDKNRKMVRTEILTKRLAQCINKRLPGGPKAFAKRAAGRVSCDFKALARVEVTGAESYTIEWNIARLAELKLPRTDIEQELKNSLDTDGAVQWG